LGLKGLAQGIGKGIGAIRNRLGSRFPSLEAKPAMSAISDPANMDSPNPAVAAAADAKAQEDAAAQKVKGLRYLAGIGCGGCYPDVEAAYLAALEDCTEEVRYEAVKALRKTAGDPCQYCRYTSCCSPKIRKKLDELGYRLRDDNVCYKEPSPRVRRLARLALSSCGGSPPPGTPDLPQEGPSGEPPEENASEAHNPG